MQEAIIFLGADLPHDSASIGQKAAVLNQLTRAGFPVPPGVCITTQVFKAAIAPFADRIHSLCVNRDLRDPAVARNVAQEIATLLNGIQLPAGLLQELSRSLPVLGSGAFAVRSSATLEDLPTASFAGQYHSVLGVEDEHEFAHAILASWRSYFSPNALAARAMYAMYANQHAASPEEDNQGMAVLIQPLLDAECSGVCFTVDPIRVRADLLLVTAAWGLGTGVVQGTAPVDTMRVRRFDLGVEETLISDKHTCIRYAAHVGVQPMAVPVAQRRMACLPEDWLRRVAQFGLAAEQHLGPPQDVEWAMAGRQVWLLQSRPITTLPEEVRRTTHFPIEWANEQERTRIWWLEGQTGRASATLLPAEIEFVKTNTQGGQAAVQYAGGAKTRWRKYVNGRVYMAAADSTVSPGDRRIRSAALMDLIDRLQLQGVTMWEHWGPEIMHATERLGAFDGNSADGNALADHLEDTLAAAQRHWMIHTLGPRRGGSERFLEIYMRVAGKGSDEAERDLPFLLQGADTVQTRLIGALYDLAGLAMHHSAVAECIQSQAPDRYSRLRDLAGAENFVQQFEQLLSIYGGRTILLAHGNGGESTIELPLPWREAPDHVLDMIAMYLPIASGRNGASPREARERARREYQAQVDAICATVADPALANEFRSRLDYARRNAAFLDEHNHYIDQLSVGQYAQALIYAGRWLAARGDLSHPYDTFWLQPPEILSALRAPAAHDFGHTIVSRKQQFEAWRNLLPPAYIGLPDAHLSERPVTEAAPDNAVAGRPSVSDHLLTGQAASSGRRSGRARIIDKSSSLPDIAPGDVLVAENAGPQWTPVFPVLAGIVLDSGGPGDHSAITAREFGIPAVFGTANATLRIPQGAWVTVDGDTGSVIWE